MFSPQPTFPSPTPQLARWQTLTIILGAALWLPLMPFAIGAYLLLFAVIVALIADWRGATTLRGLIDWSRVRHVRWLVVTSFIVFYMFAFYAYAWRVFRQSGTAAGFTTWAQQSAKNKVLAGISVAALVIANLVACASLGSGTSAANASKTMANLNQSSVIGTGSASQTATASAKASPVHHNAATSTPKPTNTPVPPTATPRPPTPTPVPPQPTTPPAPQYPAVGGNPWDFTLMDTGNLIYSAPANICT